MSRYRYNSRESDQTHDYPRDADDDDEDDDPYEGNYDAIDEDDCGDYDPISLPTTGATGSTYVYKYKYHYPWHERLKFILYGIIIAAAVFFGTFLYFHTWNLLHEPDPSTPYNYNK